MIAKRSSAPKNGPTISTFHCIAHAAGSDDIGAPSKCMPRRNRVGLWRRTTDIPAPQDTFNTNNTTGNCHVVVMVINHDGNQSCKGGKNRQLPPQFEFN
jgi:hypothetical protein